MARRKGGEGGESGETPAVANPPGQGRNTTFAAFTGFFFTEAEVGTTSPVSLDSGSPDTPTLQLGPESATYGPFSAGRWHPYPGPRIRRRSAPLRRFFSEPTTVGV